MKIGIIDIGSNSVRLVIVDVEDDSYSIIDQIKHSARLGQDMTPDGYLSEARIDYGIKVLEHFAGFMKKHQVEEAIVVATEAVRKAKNQEAFLTRARKALAKDVRVLSGLEEAFYDYFGCVNTMDIKNALIFDIGGSSTELVHIQNRYLKDSISTRLGSIPLTEMFELNNNLTEEKIASLKVFIMDRLSMIPWLKNAAGMNLIGIGGSVRTLGKIDRIRKGQEQFIAHNYSMETSDISLIREDVKNYLMTGKNRVRGLPRDREDIFIGSTILVECLAEYLHSQKVFVSGAGVRDGLLFEHLFGNKKFVPDVLQYSLRNIIHQHMSEEYDGEKVYELSEILFDALTVNDRNMRLHHKELKTAAYLNDIGKNINFYQRDRNTFYSILNAPIHGLSQKQILIAASAATLFNSDDILKEYLNKQILDQKDIRIIEKIGLIIMVVKAIVYGAVDDIAITDAKIVKNRFVIHVKTASDPMFMAEQLEYYLTHFKRVFHLSLEVVTD